PRLWKAAASTRFDTPKDTTKRWSSYRSRIRDQPVPSSQRCRGTLVSRNNNVRLVLAHCCRAQARPYSFRRLPCRQTKREENQMLRTVLAATALLAGVTVLLAQSD